MWTSLLLYWHSFIYTLVICNNWILMAVFFLLVRVNGVGLSVAFGFWVGLLKRQMLSRDGWSLLLFVLFFGCYCSVLASGLEFGFERFLVGLSREGVGARKHLWPSHVFCVPVSDRAPVVRWVSLFFVFVVVCVFSDMDSIDFRFWHCYITSGRRHAFG